MNILYLLRRLYDEIGWFGVLGLILLLFAGGINILMVAPQSAQLIELQHENKTLKIRIEQAAHAGIPETGSQDDLNRFYAFFDGVTATQSLNKIYAAATTQNLVLTKAEYRMMPVQTDKLLRYRMTLPVTGGYVQIRQFVDQVLNAVPVAALDNISFKRENIGDQPLQAHIVFMLMLDSQGTARH